MKFLSYLMLVTPLSVTAQLFTDASSNLPPSASGNNMDVRAADLDKDNDLDLVFARENTANFILKNNGMGVFTNGTSGNLPQPIRDSEDVAIGDFNNDTHLDLVFCSEDNFPNGGTNVHEFYLGNGSGMFAAAPFQLPDSEANAVITAFLNNDTLPDLIFGNNGTLTILINSGDGNFVEENDRVPAIARVTQDVILFDADGDNDADLLEGNENGNLLFINDGNGYFSDSTDTHLPGGLNIETRKIAVGDVDMDNDLDVLLANVRFIAGKDPQNRLFLNDGFGHFSDVTATQLPIDNDHTIDAIFEDVDLDADLDLVLANVFGGPLKLYENNGSGFFADSTLAVFGDYYYRDALGVIAADLNGDNYRDLYFCHRRMPGNTQKDLFLLRTAPVSVTADKPTNTPQLMVYPNPVRDHFFVIIPQGQLADSVQLHHSNGQKLAQLPLKPMGDGLYRCDLGGLVRTTGYWVISCYSRGNLLGKANLFLF
jgi:FG-GAP-like repeat